MNAAANSEFSLGLSLPPPSACAIFWWLTIPAVVAANSLPAYTPNPANGLTTFNAGGCSSCHAVPDQPDRLKLGGGLAITSPFGTFSFAEHLARSGRRHRAMERSRIRQRGAQGHRAVGRALFSGVSLCVLPACRRIEDIRDLFAYLKTLAPVSGKVRDHDVPFPFNVRRNVGIWKFLFMDGKPFTPDPARSAQWNRGAYLVNGLGHCAECHSPRNFLGGIVAAQRFAGGPNPEGEGWVPNITQKRLGEWSAKDIAYFLETGQTPDGDTAGGSMARVIRNTSQLSAEDRAAMAEYIKSLPPVEGPPRPKKAEKS